MYGTSATIGYKQIKALGVYLFQRIVRFDTNYALTRHDLDG